MEALATYAQPFFAWLLETTLLASVVICLILVAQRLLGNRLGSRWCHTLWLVLLLRMVLPWTPPSPVSLFNLIPASLRQGQSRAIIGGGQPERRSTSTRVGQTTATETRLASGQIDVQHASGAGPQANAQEVEPFAKSAFVTARRALPLLWLTGAVVLGGYLLAGNFALWRVVKREHPLTSQPILELFEACKSQMGVQTIVALVPNDRVRSAALFGFVRPRLLLPREMIETASHEELRYVFLHELAHLKRHDIYLGWLTSLLQVLHWFNPLVWLAFYRMRADRELACDALVLTRTGPGQSREYGRTIVGLLERFSCSRRLPAMAGILESQSQLKRRIAMIAKFTDRSYRWSPLAITLIVVLCCISLPDARSGKAAEPSAAKPPVASTSTEQPVAAPSGDGNVFIDPNTRTRFTKFKTVSGPSDVIAYGAGLSPNRKFLLDGIRVVPLDSGRPFDLVDMPDVARGSWSPDGRKVVFYAGAMWLIEVDPETARPVGPPRRLLEGEYRFQAPVRWSPDSRRIVFPRRDSQIRDEMWTLSIDSGELSKVTDPFDFGIVSPDGKTIACSVGQGLMYRTSLLVKSATGGEARKIADGVHPILWSSDSQWLVCTPMVNGIGEIWFVHVADGREVKIKVPGTLTQSSPGGRSLFFYQSSFDDKAGLKVVSAAGGPPAEFGWPNLSFEEWWAGYQWWSQDSRSIIVEGKRGEDKWGFWAVPLDGKAPRSVIIDTPLCRDAYMRLFSPDGSRLLLFMGGIEGTWDLWTVPVSMAQMRSSGPPVKAFGAMVPPARQVDFYVDTWSPDASRIAFVHNWDIWVAGADGESALQLTQTPERDVWPVWSPDSTMVAFGTLSSSGQGGQIRVVPASGGESRVIVDLRLKQGPLPGRPCAWLPNGKEVTIACEDEGIVANFPIGGGEPKTVARLQDLGIERASWLNWSADGRFLAFQGKIAREQQKLYVYQPDTAKLQRLTDVDIAPFYWSSDSKWISYFSTQPVKTRPEGVLWEMDVEETLAKLAK